MNRTRLLLLHAAFAAGPAAAQQPIQSDGPYVHQSARAVFPLRIGDFVRSDMFRYDRDGKDVSGSYNLAAAGGRLLITVYIYPAVAAGPGETRQRLCDAEFEAVESVISSQHDNAAPVTTGKAFAVANVGRDLRHRSVFHFRIPFDDKVQAIKSEAHLYCYVGGAWLVKYRVSAPVAVDTKKAVERFIRTGPWPGRGPAETIALAPAR